MPTSVKVRMTSFAPQLFVDDLARSIAYYEKIGFRFGEPWDGFYAIGHLDGLEVHLKESPKNQANTASKCELDASEGQRPDLLEDSTVEAGSNRCAPLLMPLQIVGTVVRWVVVGACYVRSAFEQFPGRVNPDVLLAMAS